jgi:hypothetical protein
VECILFYPPNDSVLMCGSYYSPVGGGGGGGGLLTPHTMQLLQ